MRVVQLAVAVQLACADWAVTVDILYPNLYILRDILFGPARNTNVWIYLGPSGYTAGYTFGQPVYLR
jgi:hypothetical protein